MAKGIKRKLKRVQDAVQKDITGFAQRGGQFSGGMATEGFSGGYLAALSDVQLALDGHYPCSQYAKHWEDPNDE